MNTNTIANAIRKLAGGTIFAAEFVKRSDGSLRKMLCRLRVAKDVSGAGMAYDPSDKGLLTVYDVQKRGYRMIPLDNLKTLKIRGETYHVGA